MYFLLFQAGLTLHYFIQTFTEVECAVREAMGQTFFFEYLNDPSAFYLNLTPIHLDILTANQVQVHLGGKGDMNGDEKSEKIESS